MSRFLCLNTNRHSGVELEAMLLDIGCTWTYRESRLWVLVTGGTRPGIPALGLLGPRLVRGSDRRDGGRHPEEETRVNSGCLSCWPPESPEVKKGSRVLCTMFTLVYYRPMLHSNF